LRDDLLSSSRYALMMIRFADVNRVGSMPQVSNDWVR
jgi:hypothetical protein